MALPAESGVKTEIITLMVIHRHFDRGIMIRFLSPGMAWALAAPVTIVVLYLLRRKFLPRQVPSIFLWRRSVEDYAANRPFQKLMKNLLLPLQVLAALCLSLALMNPVIPGGAAGRTIYIFDISGSMRAESGGVSRLDQARTEAVRRLREMPAEEKITIFTAGEEVRRVLLDGNREEAEAAIAAMDCGRGGADMVRALRLARAVADGKEDTAAAVTIFSDSLRADTLPASGGEMTLSIVNVGKGADNRALYSLTAADGRAYARVANFGAEGSVTLVCEADGTLCGATEVSIPAGETVGVPFDFPAEAEKIRVSIREADALGADNALEITVARGASPRVAVTADSVFLESALKVRKGLTVLRTEENALAATEADLYILGSGPLVLTTRHPEEDFSTSVAGGETENPLSDDQKRDSEENAPPATGFGSFRWATEAKSGASESVEILESPLTAGLTMKNLFFRGYWPVTGGRAAVRLGEETIIAWSEDTVVLGFDPHETNLPLKYDFPVLVQNCLNWLLGAEKENEAGQESVLPLTESDVREIAQGVEAERAAGDGGRGRELKSILLAVFLLLLVAEMGVSRYVC